MCQLSKIHSPGQNKNLATHHENEHHFILGLLIIDLIHSLLWFYMVSVIYTESGLYIQAEIYRQTPINILIN